MQLRPGPGSEPGPPRRWSVPSRPVAVRGLDPVGKGQGAVVTEVDEIAEHAGIEDATGEFVGEECRSDGVEQDAGHLVPLAGPRVDLHEGARRVEAGADVMYGADHIKGAGDYRIGAGSAWIRAPVDGDVAGHGPHRAEHRDRRCCPGHGHAAAEAPVVAVTVGGGVVAGGDVAGGEVAGGAVAGGAVAVGAVGAGPAPAGADPPPELGLAPDAELAEGAAPDEPALAA